MQQHYFHPCAPSTFSRAPQPGRTSSSENSLEAALHRPTSSAAKNVLGVRRLWTGRADPCGAPRFLLPGTTTTGLHLEGETHSYCPSRLTVLINRMQTQKCAAEDPLLSYSSISTGFRMCVSARARVEATCGSDPPKSRCPARLLCRDKFCDTELIFARSVLVCMWRPHARWSQFAIGADQTCSFSINVL
jgi:hypothetical protein